MSPPDDTEDRFARLPETVLLADRMRTIGYTNATSAGISISIDDMRIPPEKAKLVDAAQLDPEANEGAVAAKPRRLRTGRRR